jgi:hypothetical protein
MVHDSVNAFYGRENENFYSISDQGAVHLTREKLEVKFSDYELASHMEGEPTVTLDTSKIRAYLDPNGPLKQFLKESPR